MSDSFDPRRFPIRNDIAARHLEAMAPGRRLVDGRLMRVRAGASPLRAAPEQRAEQVSQALHGERFAVYDRVGDWAWGQLEIDGYVAWVRADQLTAPDPAPTHRVSAIRTILFEAPSVKAAPVLALSLNAQLVLGEADGAFLRTEDGRWVHAGHVAAVGHVEADFVAVAQRFVGSPYLWGGRESAGVDCSGLVQAALHATGARPLRDADMQETTLGDAAPFDGDLSALRRGDLLFWKGHVGIMLDPERLLHANAWHMATEIEPVAEAVARIRPVAGEVRTVRRLRTYAHLE